ncbi:LADA_0H18954g1_1 [Lachancea dasiensis]|uniref:LADA_0H18954g1_1 n=1 Tax=Lachancea dasiensis TaxID=1072105 RepID=A0A1G4K664_9SACH|nr:LADA_0H18954g1_1 [Lachancea dasiensis]
MICRVADYYKALTWERILPSFSKTSDRAVRRAMIQRSADSAIWIAVVTLCVLLPLWNYLSLKRWVFKLKHHLRHDILRKARWLHGSRFYHNQGFKVCSFWITVVTLCSLISSGGDLIQITKRLGRIAVALMPPLLFLTLRPSPLPHTLYLSLLPIHKWISRIVVLLSALHAVFYSWFFIINRSFIVKIQKLANLWGVLALFLFGFIAVTSVSQVRRYNFRLFYYVHYVATWLSVILIHYHARPPVRYYTAMNCFLLIAQVGYRIYNSSDVRVTVKDISPTLLLVDFPMSGLRNKPLMPSSHVRLAPSYKHSILQRIFQQVVPLQHPYTIASLPYDESVKLIVRRGRFNIRNNSEYFVAGAFEPKLDFMSKTEKSLFSKDVLLFQNKSPALVASPLNYNIDARRALIVAGGSAISFGLPLLRILNFNGVTVKLKWVTRDYRDLRLLNHFKNNFEGLEIYITGSETDEQDLQIDYIDFDEDETRLDLTTTPAARPSSDYGTFKSPNNSSTPTLQSQGRSNREDEIDFTQMFSSRNSRAKNFESLQNASNFFDTENSFRKPSILLAPSERETEEGAYNDDSPKSLKIPAGVQVFFGRPNLTSNDYHWCLEKECIGPSESNDCYAPKAHVDDLSRVWVLAAGPLQLVENTKRWAYDGGLHFHEESFTV